MPPVTPLPLLACTTPPVRWLPPTALPSGTAHSIRETPLGVNGMYHDNSRAFGRCRGG